MGIESAQTRRPLLQRPLTWIVAALIAVLAFAAIMLSLITPATEPTSVATTGESASPTPRPSASTPAETTTTAVGVIDTEDASDLITSALDAVAEAPVLAMPDAFLANVASGAYLAEIEAQFTELEANGWTTSGAPVVETVTVLPSTAETPATATVEACIDSSAVLVLDADGEPVGTSSSPRAKHLFTLNQEANGSWRITSHSFANDPAC